MRSILLVAQAVIAGDRLLRQPLRKRLMRLIKRQPGIHASELCRETGEPWGTVHYHLDLLRKGEAIQAVRSGRERRLYPSSMDDSHARMLSILHRGRCEEIARFVHEHPGVRQVDVCNTVGVSRKTLRMAVEALVDAGLIAEQKGLQANRYFPEASLAEALGAHAGDAPAGPDVA